MVRTGRGSTVKDPLGGSTDKERRGVTHYSYGEGALAHSTVQERVRKHTRLPLVTYLRGGERVR